MKANEIMIKSECAFFVRDVWCKQPIIWDDVSTLITCCSNLYVSECESGRKKERKRETKRKCEL